MKRLLQRATTWNGLGAIAAMAICLAGCSSGTAGGGPPEMATEVVMGRPSLAPVEEVLAAVGTIEANERVTLKPETSGTVEAIHFTEGDRVETGQKLFDLEARQEKAALTQAKAEEDLAGASLKRAQVLAGTRAISEQELDQLESELAVRSAARQVAEEQLADRSIIAPFAGVVGPREVSPGQYVVAGTLLGTLVDNTPVKVRFQIPERQLGRVKMGQEGRVRVGAFPEREFVGKVDLIAPEVDQSTRTAEIRLLVPNPDGALMPGMFARVELVVARRPEAVVIPESALLASLDKFSVFTVEDERARVRPVRVGVRMPGQVEIREGLTPDDVLILSGTQKVVDGMKVAAAKEPKEGSASASVK